MRFAFSTSGCPDWDFSTIIAKARELGYQGVELSGCRNEAGRAAADVMTSDPEKLRGEFAAGGVEAACVSSAVRWSGRRKADEQAAADLRRYVDVAAGLGCGLVRVYGAQLVPGRSLHEIAISVAEWLRPAVEYAGERGVCILVENAFPFSRATQVWEILEAVSHPGVGASLDLLTAVVAGEEPAVSVPVLNSRIQLVRVTDARLERGKASYCALGQGQMPVRKLLERLRGIGYAGWITVDGPQAAAGEALGTEQMLGEAFKRLQEWTAPPKKPDKPAAVKKPVAAAASAQ